MVVAPVLPRFTREYRDIVVEVLIENRFTNILERRFDAGIRLGESLEKDVVAVPVSGPLRLAVVGAPDYFARHPAPLHPRDLRDHSCINLRFASAGTLYKCEFEKGGRSMEVAVDGPLVFDDSELAVDAALSGVGLACVLDDQATSLVEAGALVPGPRGLVRAVSGVFPLLAGSKAGFTALAAFIEAIRVEPQPKRR